MFQPAENRAGLSPAARSGLMFQPKAKRGWTQPSRAGWADVPAQIKKGAGLSPAARAGLMFQPTEEIKTHDWLLCMSTVTSELISFFLHAERVQCTFCKQEDD